MIERIRDAAGVSCVEKYLLAVLSLRGIDERCLYTDCDLDLGRTVQAFVREKQSYADYLGKPRLQSVAREIGLLNLKTFYGQARTGEFDFVLHEVVRDYKGAGAALPWRADHYLLEIEGKFYDCLPPAESEAPDPEKRTGKKIGFRLNPAFVSPGLGEIRAATRGNLAPQGSPVSEPVSVENLCFVRDALLYVKTLRARMNAVLDCPILRAQIAALAKGASLLERFRLKGRVGDFEPERQEINQTEELWREKVRLLR